MILPKFFARFLIAVLAASLFFLVATTARAQSGSLNVSVLRSTVADSTTVTGPTQYGLLYYNHQVGEWRFRDNSGTFNPRVAGVSSNVLRSNYSNLFEGDTDFDGDGFNWTVSNFNSLNLSGNSLSLAFSTNTLTGSTANDFETPLNAFYDPTGGQPTIRLFEGNGASNYFGLKVPSLSADWNLTVPIDDGTPNQVLTTDGSGGTSWQTPAATGVTSVSGTTNRITSTGGTTPVIDISATFEALLGKVANRIDQNNASTTSAQLATTLSDETGTGTVVYSSAISGFVASSRAINTTSPLSGGGDLSADRTIAIANAAADGSTKGAASFTASDFDASSGNIAIDYANGQSANGSTKGFLTSTDWSTFNGKQAGDANLTTLAGLPTGSGVALYKVQLNSGGTDYEAVPQLANPATTNGDLIYYNGTAYARRAIGTTGQALRVAGGLPVWGDVVEDAINDAVSTVAPSENAVFDALALKAPLASPTFSGTPAAPTASVGTNTTQLATTAFANATLGGKALSSLVTGPGAGQDAYSVTWDNTNSRYTLTNVSAGAGSWLLTGTSTLTGTTTIAGASNPLTFSSTNVNNSFSFSPSWTATADAQKGWREIGTLTHSATSNRNLWAAEIGTTIVSGAANQFAQGLVLDLTFTANHTGYTVIPLDINPTLGGAQTASATNIGVRVQSGAVLVGGTTLTAGSVLADFQSTTKGVLMPRVTNIASVATPVASMIAYDAATDKFNFREGSTWTKFGTFASDISVNGLTIGRGTGNISSNTALGASALNANTTGSLNVAVGANALLLATNLSGTTAVGTSALNAATTSADYNSAFGYGAGTRITTGAFNTLIGADNSSSGGLTTGSSNILIGYQNSTSPGITTGSGNIVIGNTLTGLSSSLANNVIIAPGGTSKLSYDGTNWAIVNNGVTMKTGLLSGSFSQVGTATTTFTVTIGTTMANSTYKVGVTPTVLLSAAFFFVSSKTTTTFDVTYLSGLTGTVTFDWIVTP